MPWSWLLLALQVILSAVLFASTACRRARSRRSASPWIIETERRCHRDHGAVGINLHEGGSQVAEPPQCLKRDRPRVAEHNEAA